MTGSGLRSPLWNGGCGTLGAVRLSVTTLFPIQMQSANWTVGVSRAGRSYHQVGKLPGATVTTMANPGMLALLNSKKRRPLLKLMNEFGMQKKPFIYQSILGDLSKTDRVWRWYPRICLLSSWIILPPQLRVYPMQFASAVADLIPEMKLTKKGQPDVPQSSYWPSALEIFQMGWETTDVFQSADIGSLYEYLRKSKKLRIPDEWKDFVPVSFKDLWKSWGWTRVNTWKSQRFQLF